MSSNFELLDLIVAGDRLAFVWKGDVRTPRTGKQGATELMDVWTMTDGKIASIRQACDTAFANWMTADMA